MLTWDIPQRRNLMKIINLPQRGDAIVTVIPTNVEKWNGVLTRSFRLAEVDYSLEESTSIEGFLGYVHVIKGDHKLGPSPIAYDDKMRCVPVVAVCFIKP
jgi:hypothetical protein